MQNRELNSPDLLTRQRALMSLCDVMHNPEHISEGLRVGKYMSCMVGRNHKYSCIIVGSPVVVNFVYFV